ncbi:MAG TPA: MlaD family protein [Pseudobdellovibrionaceae bacterium]|nr:MlaD family protein [Pseudobdellovibrionaceae bacterium]
MDAKKTMQTKVGLFAIIGLIIIMGSILLLGGNRSLFEKTFRIYTFFDQVPGLNEGAVVSLSGIVVGNVEKVEFIATEGKVKVTLRVPFRHRDTIHKGTQAEIRTQGALGDKYIYLIPGPSDSSIIDEGEVLPMSRPTDLIGVLSERGGETAKVFDVLSEVYRFTQTLNRDNRVEKILANLTAASNNLVKFSTSLDKINDEKLVQGPLQKLDRILEKIDKGQGSLGGLINDPSLHQSLKSLVGGTERKDRVRSLIRTNIEKSAAEEGN